MTEASAQPQKAECPPPEEFPVIHGSVGLDGTFFFWGEGAVPDGKKRGRRPAAGSFPRHRFALPHDTLKAAIGEVLTSSASMRADERVLYLPTTDGSPDPSIEKRPVRAGPAGEKTVLAPFKIPVVQVPLKDILPYLFSGEPGGRMFRAGRSLSAWQVVALFAAELVARGSFLPGFEPTGHTSAGAVTGAWFPKLRDDDRKRLDELASLMPPVTRAHLAEKGLHPEPVRIFIKAAVRHLVPEALRTYHASANGIWSGSAHEEVWYSSLTGIPAEIPASSPTVADLKTWLAGPAAIRQQDYWTTCFTIREPDDGVPDWTIGFFLQSLKDPTLLVPAAEVWSGRAGAGGTVAGTDGPNLQERILFDLGAAAKLYPPLREALKKARPDEIALPPEEVFCFLAETAPLLREIGCSVLLPSWWQHGRQHPSIRVKLKSGKGKGKGSGALSLGSIVSFDWKIAIGDEELSAEEFGELAARKLPLMKVRGRWVVFDQNEVKRVIAAFRKEYSGSEMSLADALALSLGGPADEELPLTAMVVDKKLKEFFERLASVQAPEPVALPARFTGTLRPYQETGLSWLSMLGRSGMGACLADDMGLGKTVQVIAYLATKRDSGTEKKTLLVCPMSIIGNWSREFARFAPSLRVHIHHGQGRCSGDEFGRMLDGNDIVITSYQTVQRDEDLLVTHTWDCVVLDEAQNIKNHATRQARAVRKIPASERIALTGTPVENRLSELWSIMDFLNPGYLGNATAFQKLFATPIERQHDTQKALSLKKIVRPFLLRRTKTDRKIISDLPEKIVKREFCLLTREQVSLYEAAVEDLLERLSSLEGLARRGAVLVTLMRLKQICNHPALFLNDGSPLEGRSGKLGRLCEVLEEILENNERTLIFTQFASFGELLKPCLESIFSTEVLFLHGKTKREDRDAMVARFSDRNGPKIFILSLKAGGTGLNLTPANHVFHIDRWWNPAVEDQATDRAFRIGQTKNVEVHLMIAAGTLEERIDSVLEEKRALAGSIIGTGEDWITGLPTEELRELLRLRKAGTGGEAE
ncbi:MAG: DEAD/DEAH box helicase [Methanoregula sp.]|nr:DEAD/DEAH box helicase [Methanoregula sp.]